ncbi:DUF397 domain-containing protein [Streptomyces sp. NPDC051569]|uniref:DUF397 domain-containing protein n=1 Tax=Streptomyces sp. NPDC051569 TaxID=3365661 RepID=UPI0037BDF5A0
MNAPRRTFSDLSEARWRKSTYSGGNNECLEVADGFPGLVPIRDSKVAAAPCLVFDEDAWTAFVGAVKASRFRPV